MIRRPPRSTLFPTRRSSDLKRHAVSGQRAEARRRLRPLVGTRFQDLFHSPPGVLFTFPSRYWCTIGHRGVFSLGGWSPQLHAGLHVSRVTRDTARGRTRNPTGLSPSLAGRSRPLRLGVVLPWRGPTTPAVQAPLVWAGPRSLAATKGIAVAFSSSGYLDVSVPRVCFSLAGDDRPCDRPGFPIRKSWDHSLFAAPPGLSQLTTSFVASLCQGIHRAPLRA